MLSSIRYAVTELREKGDDPDWWYDRIVQRGVSPILTALASDPDTRIMDCDWDNLIILDACRFDLFKAVYERNDVTLGGELSRRTALGTGTPEFLRKNFADDTFHDTIYVTGNSFPVTELDPEQFHWMDEVFDDGWDDELQTVTPETMTERTLAAAERFPNKRLISHYLQPHEPFIGDVELGGRQIGLNRNKAIGEEIPADLERKPTAFRNLRNGKVSRAEVWEAYEANLERAMPAVERLLSNLSGKTVVTSDHGNAFGERAWPIPIRIYGHPLGIPIPALREVPWLVVDGGERRTVRADPPLEHRDVDESLVSERLQHLGYKE